LNFENYFDKTSDLFLKFEKFVNIKSNFKEHAGERFEIYKEKCTKPMSQAAEMHNGFEFVMTYQGISSFFGVLDKTLSQI
jgi:hypothetical protein